jgi:hypothetical protein
MFIEPVAARLKINHKFGRITAAVCSVIAVKKIPKPVRAFYPGLSPNLRFPAPRPVPVLKRHIPAYSGTPFVWEQLVR